MTKVYTVILERGAQGWSAYVPDLPGCIATGGSREEVAEWIRQAIEFHLEGLRQHREPIPEPTIDATKISVAG